MKIFRVIYKKIHDQNRSRMQVQWSSAVIEAEISDSKWGRYLEARDCGYHDADDSGAEEYAGEQVVARWRSLRGRGIA